ncbi:C40 family peptidase [Saccharicrinis fermentans]|uniref:Gamma-D-glutamyl-L-lysine endopeptidase n=1 Tax=Saccharicrinis fermentans DSM 9555 = JCM 21142 TaxID=869213 RepID=W7Y665_9BACT|nr:C40 family peptidase [Saccharicrinis fermentans]GAF03098.1 gamma-D-glutamyl-L-lysine endopeptidase [Saccharicrinis fermentans DSM 9555 = JCM 21142]
MNGSISVYSFIPVRKEPSEASELVTQILFGETFVVLEKDKKWARIKMDFDGYEGWIDAKLIFSMAETEYELWKNTDAWMVSTPKINIVKDGSGTTITIPAGSRIVFNGHDRNSFSIGKNDYFISGQIPSHKELGIREVATSLLHTPYLWGGRSYFGIDCSGLSQIVFKINGTRIPRDAYQQMELGTNVSFVEEARIGDLAFFDNEDGHIVHVGICLGSGKIIHAHGEVRVDSLDHQGIFNHDTNKYSHKLRVIKRIIPA